MIRVRYILGERLLAEFADRTAAIPALATVQEATGYFARQDRNVLPVIDSAGFLVGMLERVALLNATRAGQNERQASELVLLNFPILDGAMGAAQAYYFLKAEKRRFAAVYDGKTFLGMVHLSELLKERTRPVS